MDEAATITSLGSVPLTVLRAADHPRPGLDPSVDAHLTQLQVEGARDWAHLSTVGQVVNVDHSGHYVQLDQPAIVIDQVEAML